MHFKSLGVCVLFVVAVFAAGCGGGGGGGGGGGIAPTTSISLTGTGVPPANTDSAWASIRSAISVTALTAYAIDRNGSLLSNSGVRLDSTGSFTLTLTSPSNDVWIKITSAKGFEMRKYVGSVASSKSIGVVNASTTVEAFLLAYGLSASDTYAAATVTAALNSLYANPPSASATVYELLRAQQGSIMTQLANAKTAIMNNNTAVENALKSENLNSALPYFSLDFSSSQANLQSTVNLEHFKTVTQDRFNRYNISTYSFTITNINFTATDTAEVVVTFRVAATDSTTGTSKDTGTISNWTIIWRYENGKWVIWKDFPYLQEQIF